MNGLWAYDTLTYVIVEGDQMTDYVRAKLSGLLALTSRCNIIHLQSMSKPALPMPFIQGGI